ncbi:P-loop NTPase fold protein [Vibrio parahaemolyticus]|uniref:P-loop NTPase fold protein n=1 Tax=Vibrio parahaemolyticus TaxID=670 RepID=UPI0023621F04|nr:P-loop NTPase fold protein [Vibrio parahaemolyticus]HCE4621429.1 AAA family ATPase [Vibrio parahaemolyticus]
MLRKYQSETPADNDMFSGKGHQQVANAIANVLISDASQHIIGIEGALGAGKSTVINILASQLEDKGFHLVTFDADQYHTALKPALIQTIERELEPMLKGDRYKLAKLATAVETALGKRLTYTKVTNSHIPLSAISFMFLLGVSALQLRPFLAFMYDRLKDTPTTPMIEGILSGGLLALPFVGYGMIKSFGSDLQLGDLLKRNSRDTINETLDVNREVGAIELRQAFKVFANLIPKGKTIVLVIDNIDRVSPDIARELWSDIDTLISLGSKRFRILLPYSEKHLAKALEQSAIETNRSGKEFISKRIPIPFTAPPIASTGWRERFDHYWNETLSDIDGKEGVYELIDIWQRNITPRYLKNLVNRIGARMDSCPEDNNTLNGASCAAYLMAVRDNDIHLRQLVGDPANLDVEQSRKIKATQKVLRKYAGTTEEWPKHIAAIHYQTSFKIAQSELIVEPLRAAFKGMDAEQIVTLSALHGFDVFFIKQMAVTDAPDLVKIMAELVELSDGKELVKQYLADFNHELLDNPVIPDEFDEDLITGFRTLLDHGISIDLSIPQKEQRKIAVMVHRLARTLLGSNDPKDVSPSNDKWEELMQSVRNTYSYFTVTGKHPTFIEAPSAPMVVNVLYPMRNNISNWKIDKLALSLPMDKVVTAACHRQNVLNEKDTLFPLLLGRMRCGNLVNVKSEDLLNNVPVANNEIEDVLTQLPFSASWNQQHNTGLIQQLTLMLHNTSRQSSEDKTTIARLVALTAATLFHQFEPSTINASLPNSNGQHQNQNIAGWVKPYFSQYPDASKYLTNYLSFVPFERLLKWSQVDVVSEALFESVAKLIRDGRIYRMSSESLLKSYYSVLKNKLPNLSAYELLSWLSDWPLNDPSPSQWQDEAVNDILSHDKGELSKLLNILTDYFDNPDLTESDWMLRLSEMYSVDSMIAKHFAANENTLSHSLALSSALAKALNDQSVFDSEWLGTLFKLLGKDQQSRLSSKIRVQFFKTTTSNDIKYRSIQYYGDSFSMPNLSDEDTVEEALAFLEDAIANSKQYAIDWLVKQPSNECGWCLDSWSELNLRRLKNCLSGLKECSLTQVVDTFFDKENSTDDVA